MVPNRKGIELLRRAVLLDPNYAPPWGLLSLRYYAAARFGGGGPQMLEFSHPAAERELEPDSPNPVAELTIHRTERGELVKAHQTALELLRRRPDNPKNHHVLSYVLRYVSSEFSKAQAIVPISAPAISRTRLRFLRLRSPVMRASRWFWACARQAPAAEIHALAAKVEADDDPEVDYFFAGHLAYCGQTEAAIRMLRLAIDRNCCSYPAMDKDSLFNKLRDDPEFKKIRTSGMTCHESFLANRKRPQEHSKGTLRSSLE